MRNPNFFMDSPFLASFSFSLTATIFRNPLGLQNISIRRIFSNSGCMGTEAVGSTVWWIVGGSSVVVGRKEIEDVDDLILWWFGFTVTDVVIRDFPKR
ncbi:hypothetical protein Hanom_Chr08g00753051 [Helianthus anomalus]